MYIVAFTGHRPQKIGGYDPKAKLRQKVWWSIDAAVQAALNKHGEIGVISGGALGVDQHAADVAVGHGIPYIVAAPCHNQQSRWPQSSKNRYRELCEGTDRRLMDQVLARHLTLGGKQSTDYPGVFYVHDGPYNGPQCMQRRNEWMVDRCDALVAVWDGSAGGTANCVRYAQKVGRPIKRLKIQGIWEG